VTVLTGAGDRSDRCRQSRDVAELFYCVLESFEFW
jgi:hypothetical protein